MPDVTLEVFRGNQEGGAPVHRLHQVIALHVGRKRIGEGDGRGIVNADIDAAKAMQGCVHRGLNLGLIADIGLKRQRLSASRLDSLGGTMDSACEFGIRR